MGGFEVIPYRVIKSGEFFIVFQWANLVWGQTGQEVVIPEMADRSIQVSGVFGGGGEALGTCSIEGTNEEGWDHPVILHDVSLNLLNITTAGLKVILENIFRLRPFISEGDETTKLTVSLLISTSGHA